MQRLRIKMPDKKLIFLQMTAQVAFHYELSRLVLIF